MFTDISLTVKSGEIVALAGLVGAGRSEVARAVFGIDRYDAGHVTVHGKQLKKASPTSAMAAGIGFVPEDRRQQGLVMDMSIQQNVALASLGTLQRGGLIRASAERAMATDWASPAEDQVRQADRPGGHAQRRQPAEGRAGQVAGQEAGTAYRRRAHPRHRRRNQGGGPSSAHRPRQERRGHPDDLLRAPRGTWRRRPHPRDARGTPGGRVQPCGRLRGGRHVGRHGPARVPPTTGPTDHEATNHGGAR